MILIRPMESGLYVFFLYCIALQLHLEVESQSSELAIHDTKFPSVAAALLVMIGSVDP